MVGLKVGGFAKFIGMFQPFINIREAVIVIAGGAKTLEISKQNRLV